MSSQLLIQLQICFLLILLSSLRIKFADAYIIAKPGCKDTCGNVEIPYPFGIGVGCFFDQWFEIECRGNGSKAKPFLSSFKFEVMGINRFLGHGDFLNQNVIVKIPPLKVCAAEPQARRHNSINFTGSPYQFSADDNLLVVEGCPGSAVLHGHIGGLMAGCGTVCHNNNPAIPTNSCYGVQCCQTLLHDIDFLPFYQIAVYHKASSSEGQNCLVATLIQSDSVNQYVGKLSSSDPSYAAPVPVALTWDWISQLQADTDSHASCQRSFHILYCHCIYPYEGNPYVSGGCHVPEACKDCRGYCVPRYDVEDRRSSYCKKQPPLKLATVLVIQEWRRSIHG